MTILKVILAAALGALAATVLLAGFPRLEAHVVLVPTLSGIAGFAFGALATVAYLVYRVDVALDRHLELGTADDTRRRQATPEDAFRNAPNTVEAPHV